LEDKGRNRHIGPLLIRKRAFSFLFPLPKAVLINAVLLPTVPIDFENSKEEEK